MPKSPVSIDGGELDCILTRSQLIAAQKADLSIVKCFDEVKNTSGEKNPKYSLREGVLCRTWSPTEDADTDKEWNVVYQEVVPTSCRSHILGLTHDHPFLAHLGVKKTYN